MGCLEPPAERRPKAPWRCKHCLAHHTTKPARKLDAAETVKKKYSKVWEKNRDVRSSKYVYDYISFLVNWDAVQIACIILHILFRCSLLCKECQICDLCLQHLTSQHLTLILSCQTWVAQSTSGLKFIVEYFSKIPTGIDYPIFVILMYVTLLFIGSLKVQQVQSSVLPLIIQSKEVTHMSIKLIFLHE